jgi:hypothetical protein
MLPCGYTHDTKSGGHNFENEALIKRWWVGQKMNAMDEKFKDGKKNKLIVKTCFPLLSEVVCVFEVLECTKT